MLTSALEEGLTPRPRYHHASALLAHESGSGNHGAGHSFMLVVGGVTPHGVTADTWSLNLSSLIWREHPVSVGFIIIPAQLFFFFPPTASKFMSTLLLTELSAAPCSGPHLDCPPRLICAIDWWLFSREWFQPSSAGV